MARIAALFVGVAAGAMLFASDALAMHDMGHHTVSSGFPWDRFGLWAGIGVAAVLLVAWLAFEGRQHHWLPPHRPVPHS